MMRMRQRKTIVGVVSKEIKNPNLALSYIDRVGHSPNSMKTIELICTAA